MNGKRLLLDTNAIVAMLKGNTHLLKLTQSAAWVGISIISQIEFLCFSGLSVEDVDVFTRFASRVAVIGLTQDDHSLLARIIDVRRKSRAKLPDAIVAATALQYNAIVVTADAGFPKVEGLVIESF